MTFPILPGNSAATGYNLTRSLRFRASASAYLNRTMTTPTNNLKWTFRDMVKRGKLGTGQILFGIVSIDVSAQQYIQFDGNDKLRIFHYNSAVGIYAELITTQVFRDPSAFYDIQVAYDATQATASNRYKVYVNGAQVTSFSTATYPALNQAGYINAATQIGIGCYYPYLTNSFYDGYMAELYFIDGQALTPSSFGSTNSTTGVWQPAKYTGTYGTNGFYLPFTDNSALTTSSNVGLGKDFSGNGNYWTTNNISLTSGVTYDSMTDVPTLTSATVANYAVLNPLIPQSSQTLERGNLYINSGGSSGSDYLIPSTIGMSSGKFYCEITQGGSVTTVVGVAKDPMSRNNFYAQYSTVNEYVYITTGQKSTNNTTTSYGASWTANDVIGIALDVTAGTLEFYKNGVSQGVAFTGLSGTFYFMWASGSASANSANANFGQRPFAYTPPTGFVALNAYNLPDSTIKAGNKYMDATLYTGNGSTQTITNAGGFQPDLVWVKSRSSALEHKESNAVRGATKATKPNSTDPETTDTNGITAFNSNGFSLGTDSNYNGNATTYASWQWKANNSTSSNTSGTITSTVSVNASAGFSILTFNGTGANATVGHGLGVSPSMFIVKNLTNAAGNWAIAHSGLSSFSGNSIYLNSTAAQFSAGTFWNNLAPTSSVLNLGSSPQVNESSQPIMVQAWAEIAGFSKFNQYTGNGSADGTFVYTGFRPKVVWIKSRDGATGWRQYDTSRSPYNLSNLYLQSSSSAAELTSGASIDILSNGFKIRDSDSSVNGNTSVYIFAAWAENPYKNSLAR